jgi:hypothetical protein
MIEESQEDGFLHVFWSAHLHCLVAYKLQPLSVLLRFPHIYRT